MILVNLAIQPRDMWVQITEMGSEYAQSNLDQSLVSLIDDSDELWRLTIQGVSRSRFMELSHAIGFSVGVTKDYGEAFPVDLTLLVI